MSSSVAVEVGRLYQPIQTIADVLTASQKDIFVRLPGLVGYWPMGVRFAGNVVEHSGSGFNLFQTGTCPTGYDGNAFLHLGDGTNFVWNSSSQLNLTGLETWISSSIRGVTVGGWWMVDSYPAIQGGMITKFGATTQFSHALLVHTGSEFRYSVSGTGSSAISAAGIVPTLGQWYFVVGRFTPSAEVAVFVDGNKDVNTTAVPSSLHVSSQDLEVGRYLADNTRTLHGKARDVFICAAALSDALIEEIRVTSVP